MLCPAPPVKSTVPTSSPSIEPYSLTTQSNKRTAELRYEEALHTYSLLVKNKQYPQSGRLRVNMGNIHYEQGKFPNAIKMYRMALDQIPNTGKEIRFKIFRNIGNAFVRLGQFQDAIQVLL